MNLRSLARVEGPSLVLRLVQPEDAQYVHVLRTNPAYNQYLSEVRGTAEDQRRWIEAYKVRESKGSEFYYVIETKCGSPHGVVRLYDISGARFTWGSWILQKSAPRFAALESAVISFGVGFHALGCECAAVSARVKNERAVAFYRRFGMIELDRTEDDVHFLYRRDRYEADLDGFMRRIAVPANVSAFQE